MSRPFLTRTVQCDQRAHKAMLSLAKMSMNGREGEASSSEGDYITELTKDGPVELRVYGHQVGGHSLLMKFGKAVCKPMIPREQFFYTSIPQEIRRFTPAYYGVANIRFQQTEDGRVKLLAVPRSNCTTTETTNGKQNGHHRTTANHIISEDQPDISSNDVVGEIETLSLTHPIVRLDFYKATDGFQDREHEEEIKPSNGAFSNPWSSACMDNVQSILSHYGAAQLQDMVQDYVVLEDLTCKFECPCVLDLKMGTRQYGDDQSDEKKRKHTQRCASSTSASLGVRISGMQMYNATKDVYSFKDKYYGRSLTPDGFHMALRDFLQNGSQLRTELVPTLIAMLSQLRAMITRQGSFRFFSSSLLIIYDGKLKTPHSSSVESTGFMSSDSVMIDRRDESSWQQEDTPTNLSHPPLNNIHTSPNNQHIGQQRSSLEEARKMVDIRMIDFARTTNNMCIQDRVKYSGPDDGYIIGLDTLISAFREIANT